MNSEQPLISIIVAVFNGADTLRRCIESISGQTYACKELIVIDGGSSDGTVEILKNYDDKITYWESKPDNGIYHAWNKALNHAQGDWIMFLGADDYFWDANSLEHIIPSLNSRKSDIRVIYGRLALMTVKGELIQYSGVPWINARELFFDIMSLPHPGLFHHRDLFRDHGFFDQSFKIAADYEFLLRELKSSDALFVPDVVVAAMQVGGISNTPDAMWKSLLEVRRACLKHVPGPPGWYWIASVLRTGLRVVLWALVGETIARRVLDYGRKVLGKPPYWTVG